jgi:hypothetical protein
MTMAVMGGTTLGVPLEDLTWADGTVRMQYLSQGARVSYQSQGAGIQMRVLDPYRVALLRLEEGGWAVVIWGGGGRNHANHTVAFSERVTKITTWRANMSQLITESGITISWSKSTQCGSCGGIPEPKGYPWEGSVHIEPGGFQPSMIQETA